MPGWTRRSRMASCSIQIPPCEILRPGPDLTQIALGGLHHLTVISQQRPRLPAAAVHQHLAELALPAALTEPLSAAAALVRFALDAGGMDNITVVLAAFPPTLSLQPAVAKISPARSTRDQRGPELVLEHLSRCQSRPRPGRRPC
jgi:hypothetical protein